MGSDHNKGTANLKIFQQAMLCVGTRVESVFYLMSILLQLSSFGDSVPLNIV